MKLVRKKVEYIENNGNILDDNVYTQNATKKKSFFSPFLIWFHEAANVYCTSIQNAAGRRSHPLCLPTEVIFISAFIQPNYNFSLSISKVIKNLAIFFFGRFRLSHRLKGERENKWK